ncbi:DUF952 domain-containing protein [Gordonia aichiensis]|uniref:DUF952 domain-containing protein n=1 Tax=Gordonia aichiensis TaxID=36820 RepID=UPI00059001C7|nr:DUF952 domain-containing protein [Gordonia aichiensis]
MTSSTDGAAVERLIHLISRADWRAARGDSHLRPPSLDNVGFVHLSTPHQVHLPANRFYADEQELLALVIDTASLDAEIRWEPGVDDDPDAMLFPHLYGPLPLAAVADVITYPRGGDGAFGPFDRP